MGPRYLPSFPTRRSSDLAGSRCHGAHRYLVHTPLGDHHPHRAQDLVRLLGAARTDHHSSLEHRIQAYGRIECSAGRLLSTGVSTKIGRASCREAVNVTVGAVANERSSVWRAKMKHVSHK